MPRHDFDGAALSQGDGEGVAGRQRRAQATEAAQEDGEESGEEGGKKATKKAGKKAAKKGTALGHPHPAERHATKVVRKRRTSAKKAA